jgi:hypothetical protein
MAENTNGGQGRGWKKYFRVANTGGQLSPISGSNQFGLPGYGKQQGADYSNPGTGNDFTIATMPADCLKFIQDIPIV